jgi:nicotinamide riboside kinase
MKILITGTHGTGKSSLLNELKKLPELKDFKFIGGVTREIKDLGLLINEEGDWRTQLLCVAKDVINLLENEYNNVVYDRSILDTKIYTDYMCVNSWSREVVRVGVAVDHIFSLFRFSFDIIIWLRPEFDLEDDGVRSQNIEFQEEIDERFNFIMRTYNNSVFQLTGTLEERIQEFKKIYNDYKKD